MYAKLEWTREEATRGAHRDGTCRGGEAGEPAQSLPGCVNLAMLLCMGRCGLRVGEVIALQGKDVTGDSLHVWRGRGRRTGPFLLTLRRRRRLTPGRRCADAWVSAVIPCSPR